jgi:hypothetical protein
MAGNVPKPQADGAVRLQPASCRPMIEVQRLLRGHIMAVRHALPRSADAVDAARRANGLPKKLALSG